MDEANQRFPDHAGVLYSTACWEALAGRPDDAWTTLQRAIELDPRSREWALRDDDLASIHDRCGSGRRAVPTAAALPPEQRREHVARTGAEGPAAPTAPSRPASSR